MKLFNKNIKKLIFSISILVCINSFGANDIYVRRDDKTQHWGFGLAFDIFYGGMLFNQFNYYIASNYNDMGFNANNHVSLQYQTSTSIFAEYQYQYSNWNAVATHLKLKHRSMDYVHIGGIKETGNVNCGMNRCTTYITTVEIPFMFRHTFHKKNTELFTGIIGVGASFTIASQLMEFSLYNHETNPINWYEGSIVLSEKRKVDPFIKLGVAIDKEVFNHKIETSLIVDIFPLNNNYKYELIDNYYSSFYNDEMSKSFGTHSFSVSIAYYL
ncbi:MAG: hypothetical protein IJ180_01775 [Bacteroidales bacterium]|nr:hypothetical protein [Bacteroidales bacterium]